MPGEFYIEGLAEKLNLQGISSALKVIDGKLELVKARTDKLQGETPGEGSTTADWQLGEAGVVSIGSPENRNKVHDLTLSIHELVGTQITVRLYKQLNGIERKIYEQKFSAATDPPGLPVINGSWAIHGVLRVTLESNDDADNGKAVDFDYMLEAMS